MIPAPCAGLHVLFDSTDEIDHVRAAQYCATCPLIDACTERLADVMASAGAYGHPEGTWAGQLLLDPGRAEIRRLGGDSRAERLERENRMFDESESLLAHNAYTGGARNEWARTGHRVYDRRRKARKRAQGQAA